MRLGRSLGSGKLIQTRSRRGQPVWSLDWKDGKGQRHRQALSPDKRVAERIRAQIIGQRDLELAGLGAVEGQSRALAEIRDLYAQDLAQRCSAKHSENVALRLDHLLRWLGPVRVRDLQAIDLMRYRTERLKAGRSHRTVNCHVGGLKAMLNWAVSAGLIAENPIRNLKPLPYREEHMRHVRRALTDEEIERFLAAGEADDLELAASRAAETTIEHDTKGEAYAGRQRLPRVPQLALWRTLIETGARWGELTSTTWADLNRERMTLHLRATTTKSGRSRTIPLRAELVAELWTLRDVHQRARQRMVMPADPIFLTPEAAAWLTETTNVRRILARLLDRAGIPRQAPAGVVDIHALRHSAASRMVRHGVPLAVAARVLGHASVEMTSRVYTHLTTDDLREAVIEPAPRGKKQAVSRAS